MTDTRPATPSIAERTRRVDAGGAVVATHFLGEVAAFVLGDQDLLLVPPDGEERRIAAHGGAILASACDDARVVTGGDDGKVVATGRDGASTVIR